MSEPVTGSDYCTTQLVASANQTVTTLLVASPTEPFPSFDETHTYFYLTIVDKPSYIADSDPPTQREIVKVTDYASVTTGYSLTCVRGSAGSTAQIWALGSVAEIRPCAQWFEDVKSSGGGGAPADAEFVVMSLDATLTNERVLTAGTNVTITDNGPGGTVVIAASGGGGGGGNFLSEEFIASGTFTPGAGVEAVWITMIGGGGGGSGATSQHGGSGGGGGELVQNLLVPVSGAVTVTIGAKGTGGVAGGAGTDGGATSFGSVFIAYGGKGAAIGSVGGTGGGFNGAVGGSPSAPGKVGTTGTPESPTYFGGSSGGGGSVDQSHDGGTGGGSGGYLGAAGGATALSNGGGGGGASTIFGDGGVGGPGTENGVSSASTSYGAGGGGASGSNTAGNGTAGYCLVAWVG